MKDVDSVAKSGGKLPLEGLKQTAGMASFGISDQMELAACRNEVSAVLDGIDNQSMDDLNVAVQDLKTLCRSERNELNSKIPSGDAKNDQQIRQQIRTLTESIDSIETFQAMDKPSELDAKIAIATVLSNANDDGALGELKGQTEKLAQNIGKSINSSIGEFKK